MKVRLKQDLYDWKAGQVYDAEPFFADNLTPKERVKIKLPGCVVSVLVSWDMVEVVG